MITRPAVRALWLVIALIIAAVLIVVGTPDEADATPSQVSWNRTTVHVQSELGTDWPVQVAVEAWDDSSALDVVYSGTTCASTSCIRIVWADLPAGVLGEATTYTDALGRYKACRIEVNDSIILSQFSQYRRLSLIRHEAGHCFGFAHSTTGLDVMYQYIHEGGPQNLSDFHKARLLEVYPYPTTTTRKR